MKQTIPFRALIVLTKPGIVVGNVLAAMGGYAVGATEFSLVTFLATIVGVAAIIAGSCVINNYLDREIDSHMSRTAMRPSVTGVVSMAFGMWYAAALLILGFGTLLWFTPFLTALIGLFGAVFYVVVYGYAKRKSYWGTLVGALPGATPPLAGYVAATAGFDAGAWLLFLIMMAWQMPHFYAIAIFRRKEYARANIPVISVAKSIARAIWEMRFYGVLFVVLNVYFVYLGYAGIVYAVSMVVISLYWLQPLLGSNWQINPEKSARIVFRRSLLVLFAFSILWMATGILR